MKKLELLYSCVLVLISWEGGREREPEREGERGRGRGQTYNSYGQTDNTPELPELLAAGAGDDPNPEYRPPWLGGRLLDKKNVSTILK